MLSGYTVIHICNTQVNMYTNIQQSYKQTKRRRGKKKEMKLDEFILLIFIMTKILKNE